VKVFQAFFGALKTFERTTGAMLAASSRPTSSIAMCTTSLQLGGALFRDNIPVRIYRQLVKDVNANLPTLHRYLKLRKRMLAWRSWATKICTRAGQPGRSSLFGGGGGEHDLGRGGAAGAGVRQETGPRPARGMDRFLPSTGNARARTRRRIRRASYQLLNFNGQWDDVSTLAHESGHSMHTLLAGESQPFPTSGYAIFIAEIASTLNEILCFIVH